MKTIKGRQVKRLTPSVGSNQHLRAALRTYAAERKVIAAQDELTSRGMFDDREIASRSEHEKLERRREQILRTRRKLNHPSIDLKEEVKHSIKLDKELDLAKKRQIINENKKDLQRPNRRMRID
ncbi:MAG: hypothetical protein WC821_04900 [archaeon]|jgi:hypothetical protein